MNIRKSLIKLANKMESAWQAIDFSASPIAVKSGWYVTEFMLPGSLQHTPRIIIEDQYGREIERLLIGFHAGRNRMLIYLPQGHMTAYSESIDFTLLSRVPAWEGRARVLLICFRYLLDFFNPLVVLRMIAMQFKKPFDLSSDLLLFYAPAAETVGYMYGINKWKRYKNYSKQLAWLNKNPKIAVLIEDESQRKELTELLVIPDQILLLGKDSLDPGMEFIIPLAKTERLRNPAIIILKRAIKKANQVPKLIYTDHDYAFDESQGDKVMEPVFKPEPSAAYLHCFNYLGPSVVFSRKSIESVELHDLYNETKRYQLSLNIFSNIADVLHVSEALFVSENQSTLTTPAPLSDETLWADVHCQRKANYNTLRASRAWKESPTVDLIIPTRDGLNVLKPCVESILDKTDYQNYHIIVVDNGSELVETHEYLAKISKDSRVDVVEYPGEFNYSAINNFAISHGESDYVAMINNDIEVIHADWLKQMMVWVKQESVGIVGAKLLFGNGLVQHAGVTIGMGNAAGHIHRLEDGDSLGYQNRCVATQNMMAVTAACLITPRKVFEELGGLDEKFLKVAYNDIDYCLRVEQSGLDVIWTPEARLYHHESISRGDDLSDQHIERYFYELGILQKRWKTKGFVDKYYSKHLRISDEGVYPQITVQGNDKLRYLN